jgi:hypothetical protein
MDHSCFMARFHDDQEFMPFRQITKRPPIPTPSYAIQDFLQLGMVHEEPCIHTTHCLWLRRHLFKEATPQFCMLQIVHGRRCDDGGCVRLNEGTLYGLTLVVWRISVIIID